MRKCCHVFFFFWGELSSTNHLTSVAPCSGNKLVGGLTGHDDVASLAGGGVGVFQCIHSCLHISRSSGKKQVVSNQDDGIMEENELPFGSYKSWDTLIGNISPLSVYDSRYLEWRIVTSEALTKGMISRPLSW